MIKGSLDLEWINKFTSFLSLEQINNLSDEQILSLAMERPGHKGQYGFLLQPSFFKSQQHMSETMHALMLRLQKVDNLDEKMRQKNVYQ